MEDLPDADASIFDDTIRRVSSCWTLAGSLRLRSLLTIWYSLLKYLLSPL